MHAIPGNAMHSHSYSLRKGQHKAFVMQPYTFGFTNFEMASATTFFQLVSNLIMDTTIVSDQRLLMAMWV